MRQLEDECSDSEASSDARQSGGLTQAQRVALAEAGIPDISHMDSTNDLERKVAGLSRSLAVAVEQR
jgi:hypothetical protein